MLIAMFSIKGSPGVTSSALTLAATWPRDVVLVEADPSGGDLVYRMAPVRDGFAHDAPGLLSLAAGVRRDPSRSTLGPHILEMSCGVRLVRGISATQGAGLSDGMWSALADTLARCDGDTIVDLGRLTVGAPHLPLARVADLLVPVANASLESVMHLTEAAAALLAALPTGRPQRLRPLLVTNDGTASTDCTDLDGLLAQSGVPDSVTSALPIDAPALTRLEGGEHPAGRLGRTVLVRAGRRVALRWSGDGHDPRPIRKREAPTAHRVGSDATSRWMVPSAGGAR